jgi:2'-5' RNA ligase
MEENGPWSTDVGGPSPSGRPPRVFVGIKIARLAADGLQGAPARLIAPADIHLTLVPPWNEAAVPAAIATLDRVTAAFSSFPLTFEHVGYGPQPRRPRLLWAGCAAGDEIAALQAALLDAYGRSEERPFRPHVTLARLRGNGAATARRHPIDRPLALTQPVESVELFQSPPPGDNGYRILASSRLRAATEGQ